MVSPEPARSWSHGRSFLPSRAVGQREAAVPQTQHPAREKQNRSSLPPCLLILVPSIGQVQAVAAAPSSPLLGHRAGQRRQRESCRQGGRAEGQSEDNQLSGSLAVTYFLHSTGEGVVGRGVGGHSIQPPLCHKATG